MPACQPATANSWSGMYAKGHLRPTIGFLSTWSIYEGTTIDNYTHALLQGICAAARERDCNLLIGCGISLPGSPRASRTAWAVPGADMDFIPVGPWNTDGLIIIPDDFSNSQFAYVQDLFRSGFPVIFTTAEKPGPLVAVDNAGGTRQDLGPALDRIHQTWPDKTVIVTEFGFTPHWNSIWGPATSSLNPDQYFFVPDGTSSDSEAADVVRRQVVTEQMPIFRSKPYVDGAIFWDYQDYRTPTNYKTGLVDSEGNKRGSWEVLRDEYAPAFINSVKLSPPAGQQRIATVSLHTRGPVNMDMPAYTLRGYTLHWVMASPDGSTTFSKGELSLPVLAPGTQWSGEITLTLPAEDYVLTVSIVRPTGFSVTERSTDSSGKLVP